MTADGVARRWREQIFRTDPVDRAVAEQRVRAFYQAVGLPTPQHILWAASPLAAIWMLAVLLGDNDPYTKPLLIDVRARRPDGPAELAALAATLGEMMGLAPADVPGALGTLLTASEELHPALHALAMDRFWLLAERDSAGPEFASEGAGPFSRLDGDEQRLFGYRMPGLLRTAAGKSGAKTIDVLMLRSAQHRIYVDRAFGEIARDEAFAEASGYAVPPGMRTFWEASEACGLWWPLEGGVVLAERPVSVEDEATTLTMRWADGFTVKG